ncbi:MAG: chorismate--pyruvate lyase [Acetatifactor sp.]|nr:chorismate--pyruvate lyase [Acetatifactor sp.]
MLLSAEYVVKSIDGDYAHLLRTDASEEGDELKLVARALLPDAISEGSKLKYEMMEYSLID